MHLQTYETYGSIKPVMHKENTAVKVVNATYSYGDGPSQISALRGINLSVPTGGIYGLLGPSGCGKTTLLKCMVGRMRLRTGRVYIFGHRPGTPKSMVPGPAIGYMPQELALYYDFTIEETLTYFARVYRMKSCVIAQRIDFLLRFLDLPERTRFIGNLSGGQKRRVSLAVTLVHSPPLLILDEPTVGVDPVLRQAIWGHLVELTQTQNLTVIITTHYIEEARQASVCALMRYGRILIEASPAELLQRYNFSTLEDVFLKLCELDADNKLNHEILQRTEANNGITHADVCTYIRYEENGKNEIAIDAGIVEQSDDNKLNSKDIEERKNMENRILSDNCKSYFQKSSPLINTVAKCSALVRKNITRLRRNLPVLLFQFLLPSIEVILFCLCIGSDPFDLPVAIHNRELIVPEKFSMYSEKFIQAIDNHVVTKHYFNTADAAIESVHQGDTWAAMLIGENFTEALQTRFLQGNEAGKLTLENSKVHVYLDMTNQLIGYKLRRTFMESFQKFTKSQLEMMGLDPSHAELPVQFEIPIYGDREPTYTEFMAPGVILSISFLAAVALTALAFVLERKEGLLERSLVSGVTSYEFLMSHVLTQMFVLSVQIILLLIFTFLVFEIPCRGGFAWVIVLTYLQGVCGMGYGLLISSICVDENSAIMLALGSFYPNLLISGTVWPTQAMPTVMRYISYIFPQTIPIESLRYILSRGWGPSHPEVALGFAVTIGWTLFFLVAAVVVFRYKN